MLGGGSNGLVSKSVVIAFKTINSALEKFFGALRDKSLKFSFKDIFLRGLAPDGGLFLPEKLKIYSSDELNQLMSLSYIDLATEIEGNEEVVALLLALGAVSLMDENDLHGASNKNMAALIFYKDWSNPLKCQV